LLVFFHGSGFVLCSLDTHDGMCRNLCAGAGCVVASVDYRLAPEHKFPAGIEDCLHATRWAALHPTERGANPMRIAVAGDSAGANIAADTALRVRDESGPALCGQLLLYPVTDYHTSPRDPQLGIWYQQVGLVHLLQDEEGISARGLPKISRLIGGRVPIS
jgi:acetyl esterase